MRRRIEIGLLYSREGSYALLSEACRTGALSAIAEINADPSCSVELVAVERDPRGNLDLYGPLCAEILRDTSARHVVGCITSSSRKEVIPTLERAGGTLWYACPYEGFEASDRVVYTHACPNQHLLPLLDWTFARFGRRGYLTGSNYIWGWEIGRVARDVISAAGGTVLGERFLPIGDTDVGRIIEEIRATRPDFVLNSLIGPSSYEFLRAYAALGQEDAHFTPARCPVVSCNLTEAEFAAIGPAAEGAISAGPYFRPQGTDGGFGSSFEAAAHGAVRTLAALLSSSGQGTQGSTAELLASPVATPCRIDPETHHATLPVLIAQVRDGGFHILERRDDVPADPYLSRRDRRASQSRPNLTVVK